MPQSQELHDVCSMLSGYAERGSDPLGVLEEQALGCKRPFEAAHCTHANTQQARQHTNSNEENEVWTVEAALPQIFWARHLLLHLFWQQLQFRSSGKPCQPAAGMASQAMGSKGSQTIGQHT